MRIGDRCFVHGYVDEIRKDTIIIRNKGGYFGTNPGEVIVVNDTAHPNWIPCSEKLPENDESVLATTAWGDVTIAERVYPLSMILVGLFMMAIQMQQLMMLLRGCRFLNHTEESGMDEEIDCTDCKYYDQEDEVCGAFECYGIECPKLPREE